MHGICINIQSLIDELGIFTGTASNTLTYDNAARDIIVKLHLEKNDLTTDRNFRNTT